MNILFLRGFNNYFNRKVKKYSTLEDYQSNSGAHVNFESINFNPNDGVVTELILGNESQKENNLPLDWENNGTPDYCVCYESVESSTVIRSRWFILESERLRSGQYRLALKRDVVAEHFDTIMYSNCFVEKGCPQNNSTLIYNTEGITVNQIKNDEILLNDNTHSSWLLVYTAKNSPDSNVVDRTFKTRGYNVGSVETLDPEDIPWDLNGYNNTTIKGNGYLSVTSMIFQHSVKNLAPFVWSEVITGNSCLVRYNDDYSVRQILTYSGDGNQGMWGYWEDRDQFKMLTFNRGYDASVNPNPFYTAMRSPNSTVTYYLDQIKEYYKDKEGDQIFDHDILRYNNKMIKVSENEFKIIHIEVAENKKNNPVPTGTLTGYTVGYRSTDTLDTNFKNALNSATRAYASQIGVNVYDPSYVNYIYPVVSEYTTYNVTYDSVAYQEIQVGNTTTGMDLYTDFTNTTFDAPYNIWCLPYSGNLRFKLTGNEDSYIRVSPDASLAIARQMGANLGSGCYDVQLVPYCPIKWLADACEDHWIFSPITHVRSYMFTSVDLSGNTSSMKYGIYDATTRTTAYSFAILCDSCRGTIDIPVSLESDNYADDDILNRKLNNICNMYRICSPNYNGIFEFSLAKNGGSVTNINVDYTYRPYLPYIHVNPDFNFLYGSDWDDTRGLICGGEYSVGYYSDAWANYLLSNKNYQNIFDRQIQNLDVNNAIAKERQEFMATTGVITSGIGGAIAGGVAGSAGGIAGALIGGALGGFMGAGASLSGAVQDKEWLERQQRESRSYMIDMYNMQLENVKAIPYSLAKTDALTNNNRIFPFIEIYKCTPEEVQIVKNKLKYDGFTIGAIGKLIDFIHPIEDLSFVKGRLIQMDDYSIYDDFHIADAIYQEISKGVYIPSGGL